MTERDSPLTLSHPIDWLVGSVRRRQVAGLTHSIEVKSRIFQQKRSKGLSVRMVVVECERCGSSWSQRLQGITHWTFQCRVCRQQHHPITPTAPNREWSPPNAKEATA